MAGITRSTFYSRKSSGSDASSDMRWGDRKYLSGKIVPPSEPADSSSCVSAPSNFSPPEGSVTTSPDEFVKTFAKPVISTRFTKALAKSNELAKMCPPPLPSSLGSVTPNKRCMTWVRHGFQGSAVNVKVSSSQPKCLVDYSPTTSSASSSSRLSGKENQASSPVTARKLKLMSPASKSTTNAGSAILSHPQTSLPGRLLASIAEKQSEEVSSQPCQDNLKVVRTSTRKVVRSLFPSLSSRQILSVKAQDNRSTPTRSRLGTSSVLLPTRKRGMDSNVLPLSSPKCRVISRTVGDKEGSNSLIKIQEPESVEAHMGSSSSKPTATDEVTASLITSPDHEPICPGFSSPTVKEIEGSISPMKMQTSPDHTVCTPVEERDDRSFESIYNATMAVVEESCPASPSRKISIEADQDLFSPVTRTSPERPSAWRWPFQRKKTASASGDVVKGQRVSERLAKKPVAFTSNDSSSDSECWGESDSDVYNPSSNGSSDDEEHPDVLTRKNSARKLSAPSKFVSQVTDQETSGKNDARKLSAPSKSVSQVTDLETSDPPNFNETVNVDFVGVQDNMYVEEDVDDPGEPGTPTQKIIKKNQKLERKKLRNTGRQYTTPKGRTIKSRSLRPLPSCRAKWCNIKELSEDNRKEIFDAYWELGTFDSRVQFVAARVVVKSKKTLKVTTEPKRQRNCTLEYSLMVNQRRIVVCKQCFLTTLDENDRFVRGVVERQSGSGTNPTDQRGRHAPKHKLPLSVKEEVESHINSFPRYVSHYSRRHTKNLYLGKDLNLQKMFELYLESGATKVSLSTYSKIFKEFSPRLKFKSPQLDTCTTCNSFDNLIKCASTPEEKEILQQQLDLHTESADFAYECKRHDKKLAKKSENTVSTIVFDLEQVLQCPHLTSGNVYYLRQLGIYNLTVFVTEVKQAFNFMWHECLGKRGSDEIASCLCTFFKEYLPPSVVHVIMYSDTCSGQNKNCHMCAALAMVVQKHPTLNMIDQKFLVPGHTHLECDQAHHQIEVKKNNTAVALHHPSKFFDMVREVGPARKKFTVREMKQEDFLDFETLIKKSFNGPLVVRKVDAEGNPFLFGDVQWFRYQKKDPSSILFKRTLKEEEPFMALNWKRQRQATLPNLCPTLKYSALCEISKEKKNDILTLLPQIDVLFWPFYQDLPTGENIVDEDPDLPPEYDIVEEQLLDDV